MLARIVQIDARYALQHQALVMQCLEHVDPTIQAKVSITRVHLVGSGNDSDKRQKSWKFSAQCNQCPLFY